MYRDCLNFSRYSLLKSEIEGDFSYHKSFSVDRRQSCRSRQSSNSVTPATVRRGQAGVTLVGGLPVDKHAGGRFFDD